MFLSQKIKNFLCARLGAHAEGRPRGVTILGVTGTAKDPSKSNFLTSLVAKTVSVSALVSRTSSSTSTKCGTCTFDSVPIVIIFKVAYTQNTLTSINLNNTSDQVLWFFPTWGFYFSPGFGNGTPNYLTTSTLLSNSSYTTYYAYSSDMYGSSIKFSSDFKTIDFYGYGYSGNYYYPPSTCTAFFLQ